MYELEGAHETTRLSTTITPTATTTPYNKEREREEQVGNCLPSIWHRYGDMVPQRHVHRWTHTTRNDGQNDQSLNLLQCSLRSHLAEITNGISVFNHC